MGLKNKHSIINLQFMKIAGFYQLIIPSDGLQIFNINIYKAAPIVEIIILSITTIMGFYSMYALRDDVNQIFNYTILIFAANFAIFKLCFIIKNAKTIWNFMHNMMSINYLRYKGHTKEIYKIGRKRSSILILLSSCIWLTVVLYWSLSAILSHNSYIQVQFEDDVYYYRSNAIGLLYPVTDTFYNKYFLVFYILEIILMICWFQMMWAFDILMITACICIEHHLKTIAASYSLIGVNHNELTRNNESTKNVEAILDLEILIQDQQNVLEKTKSMYKILKTATFIQIAAESFEIIFQPCMILKLYFDGSLSPTLFLKFLFPEITYSCHLFLSCYLFTIVNDQKESMNFALYSSNWTAMSVQFKKLLLFSMRMNDSENLKMQISMKRMVNMEMFADVMHTVYSIVSVMTKNYST